MQCIKSLLYLFKDNYIFPFEKIGNKLVYIHNFMVNVYFTHTIIIYNYINIMHKIYIKMYLVSAQSTNSLYISLYLKPGLFPVKAFYLMLLGRMVVFLSFFAVLWIKYKVSQMWSMCLPFKLRPQSSPAASMYNYIHICAVN